MELSPVPQHSCSRTPLSEIHIGVLLRCILALQNRACGLDSVLSYISCVILQGATKVCKSFESGEATVVEHSTASVSPSECADDSIKSSSRIPKADPQSHERCSAAHLAFF